MKEIEDQGTGEGMRKWDTCFDCGQKFHGAVDLALGWASWKTYLGRPETNGTRCQAMAHVGGALAKSRPDEALPVLEAQVALLLRYGSRDMHLVISTQNSLALCHSQLGRHDKALVLRREIYARQVATLGASHESTILNGNNLVISLLDLELWDEARQLARKNLSHANKTHGKDHESTLFACKRVVHALCRNPAAVCDYPRESTVRDVATHFDFDTGDDLLEAETIMQDVVQRRRRVFGPAHPQTLDAERALSEVRTQLSHRTHVDSA